MKKTNPPLNGENLLEFSIDELKGQLNRRAGELGQLDKDHYELIRKEEAKQLKISVGYLDDKVVELREEKADPAEKEEQATQKSQLSQASILIQLAHSYCYLFHDDLNQGYAVIQEPVKKVFRIRGSDYKEWLCQSYYCRYRKAVSNQALQDAINTIEARAKYENQKERVYLRVANREQRIYIDLCNDLWQVVQVDRNGWQILDESPVRFIRNKGMRSLPFPIPGGNVHNLRLFINLRKKDFVLVVAWILACLRGVEPYPILILQGEQGSGKSLLTKMLRSLIDPSTVPLRKLPNKEEDLYILSYNSWLVALDNLSGLPLWASDACCRLSTGGGLSKRQLYTDSEEVLLDITRPIIINGIDDLATRPDLADRAIIPEIPMLPDEHKVSERQILSEFEEAKHEIFGAILTGLAGAIKELPNTTLETKPRLVDFALWATASESSLDFNQGEFIKNYLENRQQAIEISVEASPLASAIKRWIEQTHYWQGTATELMRELEIRVNEKERRLQSFPKTTRGLSNSLRRSASNLRAVGIQVEFKHSGKRFITLESF